MRTNANQIQQNSNRIDGPFKQSITPGQDRKFMFSKLPSIQFKQDDGQRTDIPNDIQNSIQSKPVQIIQTSGSQNIQNNQKTQQNKSFLLKQSEIIIDKQYKNTQYENQLDDNESEVQIYQYRFQTEQNSLDRNHQKQQQKLLQSIQPIQKQDQKCQKQQNNNQNPKDDNHLISGNKQYIVQIHPQNENNIPQKMKILFFDWKCMQNIKIQAEQKNINIDIELEISNYQYKLIFNNMFNKKKIGLFHTFFQQQLLNFIILTYEFQTREERIQKQYVLQTSQFKYILMEEFKIYLEQQINIDCLLNFEINQIHKDLIDIGKFYQQSNLLFVTLIDYTIEILNIQQLQQKLNQIVKNTIIQHQDKQQIIYVDFLLDIYQIKKQISQINTDNIDIKILDAQYDNVKGKNYYHIIYNFWILKQDTNEVINERLKELKFKVELAFNPTIELKIEQPEQIKIWNLFLELQYNEKQIKVDKSNIYFLISFVAEKDNYKTKKEIIQKLSQLQYSQFIYKINSSIISIFKQQQVSSLFNQELQNIKVKYKMAYLQTFEIDDQQQVIIFEGIHQLYRKDLINSQLQDNIINKIKIQSVDLIFNEFLLYLQISKQQFQYNYNCYVQITNQKQTTFVALQENLMMVYKYVSEYKSTININTVIRRRQLESRLVLERIKQIIENDNSFDEKLNTTYDQEHNLIEYSGPENVINDFDKKLDKIIQNETSKLKTINIKIPSKVWDYLIDNHKPLFYDFEKQNPCIFNIKGDNENISNGQIRAKLQFKNKTLIIKYGNIIQQQYDAIVNSCDEQIKFNTLNTSTTKIFEYGGTNYINHIKDIYKNGKLIDAHIYKLPNSTAIKNIISVPYINYSTTNMKIHQFLSQMQSIFKLVEKNQLSSLVIPMLGGGSVGYQFDTISHHELNEVLIQMENSQFIKNVIIIENQQFKIEVLVNQLKNLLNTHKVKQTKYQFQWKNKDGWKNYEEYEINQKIDTAYQQYLKNNNINEIQIIFPFTKQPGTHFVDLKKMRITDLYTQKREKISYNKSYFFNGQPIETALSQYIEKQQLNNQLEFKIFLKKYRVVFKNKDKIIQINLETKYEREVRFLLYQKQQIQQNQFPIQGQFQFEEFQINTNYQEQIDLAVKSYEQDNLIKAQKFIDDLIEENTTTIKWNVINLDDNGYVQVEEEIKKRSIYYKGQVGAFNKIKIYCLKSENQLLTDYLRKLTPIENLIYPATWKPQNINMITVELSENDDEYKQVSQLFWNSYQQGKIYQINRIQNKILYENFNTEKQKLIKFRQLQGQQLTQIELERYVWHGVSNQHPQIIYSGLKEAFDTSYSQDDNTWGLGMYFAENSIYSKQYSYNLQPQDSQQYQGKLIFLLCLITTGKVIKLSSDKSLKRPPNGYDCVKGYSGGSDIYVLYQMEVRRAYPAYEVIYE